MPNELCAELHNRMPVVLKPETWPVWLGEEPAVASALKALLTPFPSDEASRTLRTSSGPTLRADHTAIDTSSPGERVSIRPASFFLFTSCFPVISTGMAGNHVFEPTLPDSVAGCLSELLGLMVQR